MFKAKTMSLNELKDVEEEDSQEELYDFFSNDESRYIQMLKNKERDRNPANSQHAIDKSMSSQSNQRQSGPTNLMSPYNQSSNKRRGLQSKK